MARDHARIMLSIWDDEDFRALTPNAQHLYLVLTIHPQLNYCGVADWRPARLAGFAAGWTSSDVEIAGKELADRLYVLIDESTEEVLLRSFIRNDGLLNQPNLGVSVRKAYTSVSSAALRKVIVHELCRLRADKPDLKGWDKLEEVLSNPSVDPSNHPSFHPSIDPSDDPSVSGSIDPETTPSVDPSDDPSPTTSPSPTPSPNSKKEAPQNRGTRLTDDWKPTPDDIEWQRQKRIPDDFARRAVEKFVLYWTAKSGKDATKLDWSKTWRIWLLTEQERNPQQAGAPTRRINPLNELSRGNRP